MRRRLAGQAASRGSGPPAGPALLCLALLAPPAAAGAPPSKNGFALEPRGIPLEEIHHGGPARDGIPALDHPAAVTPAEASWAEDELVVGVQHAGQARAYPVAILVWHELVNDTLGGEPILVSYCPLCGTAIVFDRRVDDTPRRFGVSGLLYQSDLLLYDRETESLWSQISAEAVTGPSLGRRLRLLRSRMDTWGRWRRAHPQTTVLSRDTGHRRRYGASPYGSYALSERLLFPAPRDTRYHPKMPTVGLRLPGGAARAYPAAELVRAGGRVEEPFEGRPVAVAYDEQAQLFEVQAPEGVEVIEGFWFAWMAFHPASSVFVAPAEPRGRAAARPATAHQGDHP